MHEVSTKIGGHLVMADEDQKLRVRLVGRNGRRRYEAASKERLVASCLEPGVSVSRLALEHGVNANLLRKWIKKHTATRSLPRSSPSAFIPVRGGCKSWDHETNGQKRSPAGDDASKIWR
jgi:transposase